MNWRLMGFLFSLFLTMALLIPMIFNIPIVPVFLTRIIFAYILGTISLVFLGLYLKDLLR